MSLRKYISSTMQSLIRNPIARGMTSLVIGLLTFTLILLNRSPNLLRPISLILRTGFTLVIPLATIAIYLAFRLRGWLGEVASLTLTLALFAFPLAGLWASGQSQPTVLSGLIPLYDAEAYYIDSLRLLAGQDFSIFSARRPLFPGLLSALLFVTGRNLMTTLAILTAMVALACYLAAKEIRRIHRPEAAVFVLIIVFLFYRAHSGLTMSEHLGVALGSLGFGLLYRGAAEYRQRIIWLGLLTTTLALNARAGAFFILPLLVIWAGLLFREHGQRFSWKAFLSCSTAVIIGFAFNLLLVRVLAGPSGVPFSNFSYTFFGLASGGKYWTYIFEVHPEVQALTGLEKSRRIFQLAFELIRRNPWLLVQGALFNWKMLFSNSWYNVYAYVSGENGTVNMIARWVLYLLSVLGLIKCFRKPYNPNATLVIVSTLGILLSVPFLPPTDAYRMRPYAASIIVFGVLPAMGLVFLIDHWQKDTTKKQRDGIVEHGLIAWYSILLIIIMLASPFLLKSINKPLRFPQSTCPLNTNQIIIRFDPGTSVNILQQNNQKLDWMPDFHIGLFKANAHSLADINVIQWASTIEPQHSLFYAMDYLSYKKALIVIQTGLLPDPGRFLKICGTLETDPNLDSFRIFYASEVQQIESYTSRE
jgi:hypothetical protein